MTAHDAPPVRSPPLGRDGRASSRGALLAAALHEFSEKGYDAATVAGIAERAGVTTGALYAHFEGKLDVLLEAIGMKTADTFARTINEVAALPWNEAVEVLAHWLGWSPDRRAVLVLDVLVVARRDPQVAATVGRGVHAFVEASADAARAGAAAGLIDPALEPEDLARLFTAISFGLLVLAALDEDPPSDEALVRVTDLLLQSHGHGVGTQPARLARVRARSCAADRAQHELEDAIAAAAEDGHSLRRIGEAAGLSHERVRRILARRHVS
jgi:AcrR family transcriptional regulator